MIGTIHLVTLASIDCRSRILLLVLVTASVLVSACGGGNTDQVASVTGATSGAAGASTAGLSGGTLVLRIAGTDPGVSYDVLAVAGNAELAGTLSLQFTDGYTPASGQRFALITAKSFTGGFIAIKSTPAFKLSTSRDATNFYVTVSP